LETSKEKFDRTMEEVQESKVVGMPSAEEVDEVEKEAQKLSNEKVQRSHLTADEKSLLTQVLKSHSENKISDPVLLQLIKMREIAKQKYLEKQSSIKAIYVGVLKELNDLSQEAIKFQGAIESTDKQILEFLKEQQTDGEGPPAA
jgi:hypothetical protein